VSRTKLTHISPQFVEFIPKELSDGVLYISEAYGTASHNCACGCGIRVVTPLTPFDWQVIKHGRSVSLVPSIGNHDYPCRSHYWITENRIDWAPKWSRNRIEAARLKDRERKDAYFATPAPDPPSGWFKSMWVRVKRWVARGKS
jgi:hypothetical protein